MKIAVHISTGKVNGHTRMMLELAGAFAERGHQVDLLAHGTGRHLDADLPPSCRLVHLAHGNRHRGLLRAVTRDLGFFLPFVKLRPHGTFAHIRQTAKYLEEEEPDVVLVAQDIAPAVAFARKLSRVRSKIVIRVNTNLDAYFRNNARYAKRHMRVFSEAFRLADAFVFLTESERSAHSTQIGKRPNKTVPNPLPRKLAETDPDGIPVPHPWLAGNDVPVVVAVGRLHEQKNFELLLDAVYLVRKERPIRVLVLGEGPERSVLERKARSLGISYDVSFPGMVPSPADYCRHADLFVLSSRWEGFPNVLLEALWAGCPIVSTDCPFGPTEALDGGRYGKLVPTDNPLQMAEAIKAMLDQPFPDTAALRRRAKSYDLDKIAGDYLELMSQVCASELT